MTSLFQGLKPWVRVTLIIVALLIIGAVVVVSPSFVGRGVEIGPIKILGGLLEFAIKIPAAETAAERGCREKLESIKARAQVLQDDIEAQRAKEARIEQSMAKTQEACLAEVSNRPEAVQSGCLVAPPEPPQQGTMYFRARRRDDPPPPPPPPRGASGYHRAVLEERETARAAIADEIRLLKEELNRLHEERQRRDQQCSAGEQQPR